MILALLRQLNNSFYLWTVLWGIVPFVSSPFFQDPLYTPKLMMGFGGLFLVAFGWRQKKFQIPQIVISKGVLIVTLSTLCYLLFFLPSDPSFLFYLAFVVTAVLVSCGLIDESSEDFWSCVALAITLCGVICCLMSVWQMFHSILDPSYYERTKNTGAYALTFGNINIFAQYIVLTIPFALYVLQVSRTVPARVSAAFGLITLVSVLSLTFCRSATLGAIVSFIFFIVFMKNNRILKLGILGYTIICVLILAPRFPLKEKTLDSVKLSSISARQEHYNNSMDILGFYPMGIGVGKYAFNTYPFRYSGVSGYKPMYNERSPHNEFVKVAVEGGLLVFILYTALALLFISSLMKMAWKRRGREGALVLSLLAILFIEMNLQFPFEMVHPLLTFSLLIAYLLSNSESKKITLIVRPVHRVLLCLFITITIGLFSHNSKEVDYYFGDFTKVMCGYQMMDWRRCLNFSQAIAASYPDQSTQVIDGLLYYNPFNIHIVNEKVVRQKLTGDEENSCKGFAIQNEIYKENSLLPQEAFEGCVLNANQNKNAVELMGAWLKASGIRIHPVYQTILDHIP